MINRDDASGFRLDTITTFKQYATPVVTGMDAPELTLLTNILQYCK